MSVELFPNVQVTEEQRANAAWAVCYLTGYSGEWDDNLAMWRHYKNSLIGSLRRHYQVAKRKEAVEAVPNEGDFDIGIPE